MIHFQHKARLGIIQGGHLGRMMIQEAVDLDIFTRVLDPNTDAPCSSIANEFVVGDQMDFQTVLEFGKKCDIVTLEFEHVNVDALEALEKMGIIVRPSSQSLRIIQDKGLQKLFYKENGIPTADFVMVENKSDLEKHRDFFPVFQKKRISGYDGHGVQKLASFEESENAFDEPSVLEKEISNAKEISVLVARGVEGEIAHFPVVELMFHPEKHLVEFTFAPANISENVSKKAQSLASQIVEKLGIIGLLAVEMFVLPDETILINEIAPRPHNSGHHTIEANATSQFAQHLRAVLGLPLGSTKAYSLAVMVNILGEEGYTGEAVWEGLEETMKLPEVYPHVYGKKETRPFRKMGHVTILDENISSALEKAKKVQKMIRVISAQI